jgi:hypothetical protein
LLAHVIGVVRQFPLIGENRGKIVGLAHEVKRA